MTTQQVNPNDPYGFAKLSATELRKMIADETKSMQEVSDNKKALVGAINETLAESKTRIKKAVEFLLLAEAAGTDLAHENRVVSFLKTADAPKQ